MEPINAGKTYTKVIWEMSPKQLENSINEFLQSVPDHEVHEIKYQFTPGAWTAMIILKTVTVARFPQK